MKPSVYKDIPLKTFLADRADDWKTAYPRPSLRRTDDTCRILSEWDLTCIHEKNGAKTPLGGIRLPFPPESPLSGIGMTLDDGEAWLYECAFSLSEEEMRGHILFHLPPTDQMCIVTPNDHSYEEQISFPAPTTLDITEYVTAGDNKLTVFVRDPMDPDIPYGKQCKKRGGMWYAPTSGMRGMPWIEYVPQDYIRDIRITSTLDAVTIAVTGCETREKVLTYETEHGSETVSFTDGSVTIHISNPRHWTPNDPYVYRFTIRCGEDEISSYFALRTITAEHKNGSSVLCLNGKPHYFHGLLDQGYDPDGIELPASPDGYRRDIEAAKSLGFDTLRKHIRIDDPYFYYYCDILGMCVFQDFVNNGGYSFFRDTALPTIGIRRGIRRHASDTQKQNFIRAADETVHLLYNHPSVVYYTIFNEGWGQFDPDTMYRRYHEMDSTRIWDTTSGWFFGKESDVQSEHVYFRRLNLKSDGKRPFVLSEFGGYACKIDGHMFNTEKSYGYKTLSDPAALTEALDKLYRDEVLPMIGHGLCVTIYTQITDVEDEINGLYTYDRRVCKVNAETMRKIAGELYAAFEEQWKQV